MRIQTDESRRAFLRGRFRESPRRPLPPWLKPEGFFDACSRCGDCIAACPEKILISGDGGFPAVDFSIGACTFCRACAEACPDSLFDLTQSAPWALHANISDACFATRGIDCQSCRESCDVDAIGIVLSPGRAAQPTIRLSNCTSCGGCVSLCPADAISIVPATPITERDQHGD